MNAAPAPVPTPRSGPATPVAAERVVRVSNGLKDFLWVLSDAKHGRLLDLGPVWQSTVTFFIERGFRVTTEDFLRSWKEYLDHEKERLEGGPLGEGAEMMAPNALAERFMSLALAYPPESFHAILAWDLLDYLHDELVPRVMGRIYDLLRPGGAVLAVFHSRQAERFHRYRIVQGHSVELVPAPPLAPHERVLQNREILTLFGQFRSSRTFVGRDQLREGLFLK